MNRGKSTSRARCCAFLLPILLLGARCPVPGQTFFVSGEGARSSAMLDFLAPVAVLNAGSDRVGEREVVEGDLFRVLAPGRLLNLNAYRGLQVIDLADATRPRIIGRLALSGQPVELYVVGDIAFVLLNGAHGHGGVSYLGGFESSPTSLIVSVDLSDPTAPVLLDQVEVPGSIQTSRLTREGDQAALYVAASEWGSWDPASYASRAIVASFDVADGRLAPVDRVELDGSVAAVQATAELLMVARHHTGLLGGGNRVALIDIRDPSGVMALGAEVVVAGQVQSQFNMDYYRGVLRVVSGGLDGQNHLETFEASDPSNAVPIDSETFGANESLFATLFLGNRAFFVTYLRVDPFHAYEISDDGLITPGAEFEVSGWNDFFRAVFDDSRLIGIGIDDQAGRTLAVSLYDVSDLTNSEPLLARERVAAEYSGSEANFDHRAFSVLEDAVAVPGPGGVVETGLVLLPFTAWGDASDSAAGVQIFTFSDHTLTRRGSMSHGTPVRRSFAAGDSVVANLGDTKLGLFSTADPEQPVELGSLELAPSYTDVWRFGDYRVRLLDESGWGFGGPVTPTAIEVVPGDADPDIAEPVARFEIAPGATVHRTGPYLVSVAFEVDASGATPQSEITVHDLRDPTQPRQVGQLRSDRLQPPYYGYWPMLGDMAIASCRGCFAPWPVASQHSVAVPDGLAFLQSAWDRPWTLDVLDLGDPTTPRFAESIALGAGDEGVGLLVDGSDAWVATKRHARTDRRGRASARYFALRVDVSDPSAPVPGEPINVPGELVAIEGSRIFTREQQWSAGVLETGVVRLIVEPPVARVEAVRWFPERNVEKVALDGAGHVLVSQAPAWSWWNEQQGSPNVLTVLDAGSDDLAVLSESTLTSHASLLDTIPGRALFRVSEGVLVFDLDDASAPYPRAFHATRSWVEQIRIDGRSALVAGGRYGIQLLDLDAANLP